MVRRVHKYADGGKVVKDHTDTGYVYPKPSYVDAVKDRVKGAFTGGAAGKAGKTLAETKSRRDKQIEEAGG